MLIATMSYWMPGKPQTKLAQPNTLYYLYYFWHMDGASILPCSMPEKMWGFRGRGGVRVPAISVSTDRQRISGI